MMNKDGHRVVTLLMHQNMQSAIRAKMGRTVALEMWSLLQF